MTNTDTTTHATDTNGSTTNGTGSGATPDGALTAIVDRALSAYCDPDAMRRAATIAEIWEADGELLDPPLAGRGHAELAALTDAVLAHFPDHIFRRTSVVDSHHGRGRYQWELVGPSGAAGLAGTDFVEVADSGRIRRIVGFFGPLTDA